nr:hypothetical protein [Tanacetum cinerariifolium]
APPSSPAGFSGELRSTAATTYPASPLSHHYIATSLSSMAASTAASSPPHPTTNLPSRLHLTTGSSPPSPQPPRHLLTATTIPPSHCHRKEKSVFVYVVVMTGLAPLRVRLVSVSSSRKRIKAFGLDIKRIRAVWFDRKLSTNGCVWLDSFAVRVRLGQQ